MDTQKAIKWIKTAFVAALGGGIAGAFAAAMDPTKYSLAHDIGSGKLWKYFGLGAALTLGGVLMHSPLGQSAMQAYRNSQQQLEDDKAELEKLKAELKGGANAGKAGTKTETGGKEKGPG